ncbi:hypothetical protein NW768_007641 [Fusarium equiseti]|uniref:Uncharacterized protein n=1 Tax=Fusarium equiseti TaxID=61235 RepID=A0ABQ8R826_FUSEQ|nr:hypothetical protein NW768_007641 [Fusarium equiseti]
MTFPTPPDEFPWPGWSVLETMMSAANPPNGMSQNQLVWTPAEESHIACDVDSSSQSHGSTDLNTQCQCGELARKHMNYRIDTQDLWGFLTRQRDSVGLAQKVLDCEDCGSLDNLPSQVAGNVMLFGAIMMDATSSCQSFIRALKQRALASADERCDVQIYLASKEAKDNHIEYQLERQHIWPLAKVLLRVETEKFHRICIAFITRQWRVHEKGHEICLPGGTCKKPKTTQTTSPADFCPRSTEPTLFFNCFRTAKHLQSVITDLQKDLE